MGSRIPDRIALTVGGTHTDLRSINVLKERWKVTGSLYKDPYYCSTTRKSSRFIKHQRKSLKIYTQARSLCKDPWGTGKISAEKDPLIQGGSQDLHTLNELTGSDVGTHKISGKPKNKPTIWRWFIPAISNGDDLGIVFEIGFPRLYIDI